MNDDANQSIQELLPWLANDTLSDAEREVAIEYSQTDIEGRRQLRQWRQLGQQMPGEVFDGSGEDLAWARLNRSLKQQPRQNFWARPISRGQLAASFAAVAALGLLLSLSLAPERAIESQVFTTLSTPTEVVVDANSVVFRVVFDSVSEPELRALLSERDASLISQSADTGVMVIAVPRDSAASKLAVWRSDERVRFAEQVQ